MSDEPNDEAPYPVNAGAGFLWAMLVFVLLAFAYLTYGPGIDHGYVGYGALFAIPFALGALITGTGAVPFEKAGCLLAPLALFAVIFPFVYFGMAEGLVCMVMVLPIWLAAGIGGGIAAVLISRRERKWMASASRFHTSALALLPFALIAAEQTNPPDWQERTVTRSIIIEASAAEVWPMLLAIPDIAPTEGTSSFSHDWVGIPRPSDAELVQTETGLVRKARWGSSIRFEEHVTAIEEGKRIAWDFVFPDDSVQDHTDKHIDPDGPVLKIANGGYELREIAQGKVELKLTTRYTMRTRLDWYLGLWGEQMLGDVHDNVLAIIKDRAESAN